MVNEKINFCGAEDTSTRWKFFRMRDTPMKRVMDRWKEHNLVPAVVPAKRTIIRTRTHVPVTRSILRARKATRTHRPFHMAIMGSREDKLGD